MSYNNIQDKYKKIAGIVKSASCQGRVSRQEK